MLDLAIKLFGTLALLGEVLSELFLLALEILDLGGALDFFLLELTLLCFTEGEALLLLRMGSRASEGVREESTKTSGSIWVSILWSCSRAAR